MKLLKCLWRAFYTNKKFERKCLNIQEIWCRTHLSDNYFLTWPNQSSVQINNDIITIFSTTHLTPIILYYRYTFFKNCSLFDLLNNLFNNFKCGKHKHEFKLKGLRKLNRFRVWGKHADYTNKTIE